MEITPIMTTEEVVAILKITRNSLYKAKELKPTKRFGKNFYNRADVMAYLGVKQADNV